MAEEMKSARIAATADSSIVAVNWGRGHGQIEIGVREPEADTHPYKRKYSHYTQLDLEDARVLVNVLRRAIRSAGAVD